MLPVENSTIGHCKLILLARYAPDFSRDILIPEIEANSSQYHADPQIGKNFPKYKFAENSLYFYHDYAYADIPTGQAYDAIMRINNGVIEQASILKCRATILCFFSEFKPQPIPYAPHGHHASCLIQFHDGIPDIVQELYEIVEKKPIKITQEICLCSFDALKASSGAPFAT